MRLANLFLGTLLTIGSISGCVTTTVIEHPRWPFWADDISNVCSQMAVRNVNYLVKNPIEDVECPSCGDQKKKDQQIIEFDTKFYLGLIEYLKQRKIEFRLSNH